MSSTKSDKTPIKFVAASLSRWSTCEDVWEALDQKELPSLHPADLDLFHADWMHALGSGVLDTNVVMRSCFEGLVLAEMDHQTSPTAQLDLVERLLRKFEINKRLARTYDARTYKPTSEREITKKDYRLFSAMLFQAYRLTSDLRLISALLKTNAASATTLSRVTEILSKNDH